MTRNRTLTEEETLEKTLMVFWEFGYDQTGIASLSKAINLGPSSIYNAYGSKIGIFTKTLDHYLATRVHCILEILHDGHNKNTQTILQSLFHSLIDLYTGTNTPKGCAVFQSTGSVMPEKSEAYRVTQNIKNELIDSLKKFYAFREKSGERLLETPSSLAIYTITLLIGMSQGARDGLAKKDLIKIGDCFIKYNFN